MIIAWNVFQHFYPYFDVVRTDWQAELPKALHAAATDPGIDAFHQTLLRLVAALKDGHGRVNSPRSTAFLVPPVTLDWIEDRLTVTRAQDGKSEGLVPGDRILSIDGKPIDKAAAEARALISGATGQWIRWRLAADLSRCSPQTRRIALEVEPFAKPGTSRSAELACAPPAPKFTGAYSGPRAVNDTAELQPGIFYVDLDRISEADWNAAVPRLAKAKGIIFDMRGYPGRPGILSLRHLTATTIQCARWNIPDVAEPDRRIFLTDGRAISYAETVMGIVEAYKLGEILGGPTAGTNGNVNPFNLPGGQGRYKVWLGEKYNFIVKLAMALGNQPETTRIEIKQLSHEPSPASLFTPPSGCKQVGGVSTATGGHAEVSTEVKVSQQRTLGAAKVTTVRLRLVPESYAGPCPSRVQLVGEITTDGPGTVWYQFLAGALAVAGAREGTVTFDAAGAKTVTLDATLRATPRVPHLSMLAAMQDEQGRHGPQNVTSGPVKYNMTCNAPPGR